MDTLQRQQAWFGTLGGGNRKYKAVTRIDILQAKIDEDGILRFYSNGILVNITVTYPELFLNGELYEIEELEDNESGVLTHSGGNGGRYTFQKGLDARYASGMTR